MDLKAFVAGENIVAPGRGLGFTESPPRKPIISAVEGYALAGGTELVLATDLVVASRGGPFRYPRVKRGLAAGAGGLLRLPQRIPYQKAMEYALTGDPFTAEEAAAYGFVNTLTEPGGALAGALALADRITANGHSPSRRRRRYSSDRRVGRRRGVRPAARGDRAVFGSEDAREGATAFAEKRAPVWKGR